MKTARVTRHTHYGRRREINGEKYCDVLYVPRHDDKVVLREVLSLAIKQNHRENATL